MRSVSGNNPVSAHGSESRAVLGSGWAAAHFLLLRAGPLAPRASPPALPSVRGPGNTPLAAAPAEQTPGRVSGSTPRRERGFPRGPGPGEARGGGGGGGFLGVDRSPELRGRYQGCARRAGALDGATSSTTRPGGRGTSPSRRVYCQHRPEAAGTPPCAPAARRLPAPGGNPPRPPYDGPPVPAKPAGASVT